MPVEKPAKNRLSRLKKRPQYLKVARGRRHAVPGLVLQALKRSPEAPSPPDSRNDNGGDGKGVKPGIQPVPDDIIRVGFTATKKTGNAVARNRIKRRLKAAAADVMPGAANPGFDYVLVGRAATFDRPWQSLLDDLGLALQMVHQPRRQKGGEPRNNANRKRS
jgi:ribonuclease P protein component